jgi:hypothetical protein
MGWNGCWRRGRDHRMCVAEKNPRVGIGEAARNPTIAMSTLGFSCTLYLNFYPAHFPLFE